MSIIKVFNSMSKERSFFFKNFTTQRKLLLTFCLCTFFCFPVLYVKSLKKGFCDHKECSYKPNFTLIICINLSSYFNFLCITFSTQNRNDTYLMEL